MANWPVIVVPARTFLEPDFRDDLAAYAKSGGRLVLIGPGPRTLFAGELGTASGFSLVCVDQVDDTFATVLKKTFPEPIVTVTGTREVDVSPRRLHGILSIHLVNTSGPHADAPDGGIRSVQPVGPLTVSIRLERPPQAIIMQPEGESLDVTWSPGRALVTVPTLGLYSILVVQP
jgi:hypothetical protein